MLLGKKRLRSFFFFLFNLFSPKTKKKSINLMYRKELTYISEKTLAKYILYFKKREDDLKMFKNLFSKFAKEEKGAPIIEIVILIAISALIAAFLFPTLRDSLGNWFNEMVINVKNGIGGTSAAATPPVAAPPINNLTW
jgi:Flp pilus assembly pilin Flp